MATVSGFSSLSSIRRPKSLLLLLPSSSSSIPLGTVRLQGHSNIVNGNPNATIVARSNKQLLRRRAIVRSVSEDTLIPEEVWEEVDSTNDQPVSVPVSPSDVLTMLFQAEGTMNETAIPIVISTLEETKGISNLKVQLVEGIATIELTKQTTVQATGVASSLVEIIQGSGFKLQTLNLSFEDEDGIL